MNFLLILVCTLILSTPIFGKGNSNKRTTDEITTYGDLLISNEESLLDRNHIFLLSFGFDSSNPLLDVYNCTLKYKYRFNDFYELGLANRFFSSDKTALLKSVENNFGLLGVKINTEEPKSSHHLTFGLIPLKGLLNFFSLTVIPYEFIISIGPGIRYTKIDSYWGYIWSVQSVVRITNSFGLTFGFDQDAEAGFSKRKTVYRNQINLGFNYFY